MSAALQHPWQTALRSSRLWRWTTLLALSLLLAAPRPSGAPAHNPALSPQLAEAAPHPALHAQDVAHLMLVALHHQDAHDPTVGVRAALRFAPDNDVSLLRKIAAVEHMLHAPAYAPLRRAHHVWLSTPTKAGDQLRYVVRTRSLGDHHAFTLSLALDDHGAWRVRALLPLHSLPTGAPMRALPLQVLPERATQFCLARGDFDA